MITVGLTGSIGMGKSTVTAMFAHEGAMVWNADDAVHRLYEADGAGALALADHFPSAIDENGVDREKLAALVLDAPAALKVLEAIVHPLVAQDRAEFMSRAAKDGADIVVLDIPLLFEKDYAKFFDVVVVVSAPAQVQRERVLSRPGMTEEKFRTILMKQTPDAAKRERADYVIDTSLALEQTQEQVRKTIAVLRERFELESPINQQQAE